MIPAGLRVRTQAGFTLTELLVGLLLSWLLAGLAISTLAVQRRVLSTLARRAEVLATARVTRHVLGAEVRGQASEDGTVLVTRDSLVLRAFRGQGLVCPTRRDVPGTVTVSWSGVRAPAPGSDSVLVVFSSGVAEGRTLLHRGGAPAGCPGGIDLPWERWTLSEPVGPEAVLVRHFRSVSYHIGAGALRLRSGGGGRQPLTPGVLDPARSGFVDGDDGISAILTPTGGDEEPSWLVLLAGRRPRG